MQMSYSFRIYVSDSLTRDSLVEAVSSTSGLKIPAGANLHATPMFVPVERKGHYAFTIDGPQDELAQDVPHDVTASILGVGHSFEVSVEGGLPEMTPVAWKFAKKLAKISGGVAIDFQTNERWPATSSRKFVKPVKGTEIDIVAIYWYYVVDETPVDLPVRILNLARTFLPKAVPRKYTHGPTKSRNPDRERCRIPGIIHRATSLGDPQTLHAACLQHLHRRPRTVQRNRHLHHFSECKP
jgi:hypothetical protein